MFPSLFAISHGVTAYSVESRSSFTKPYITCRFHANTQDGSTLPSAVVLKSVASFRSGFLAYMRITR